MAVDLTGRVALVTGAGRGIGAAVARQLAERGATVVVNDLGVALDGSGEQSSPGQLVVQEIEAAGGTASADATDVSDFDATERMIADTVERYGRLDILVNAAGIIRDRMIWNMTAQEFDSVLKVHLYGTFNTSRHLAAHWRASGDVVAGRRIINFTSASGMFGATGQPNYSAAKLGIVGLTYSCANALERMGATVNALSPAADTRMTPNPADPEDPEAVERRSPERCATAVVWLAGDDASWCTGQVIGARGYDVTLYSLSRPIARLRGEKSWSADDLSASALEEFAPLVQSISRPTWPPVELLPGELDPREEAVLNGAL